jgi:hypothetical protein
VFRRRGTVPLLNNDQSIPAVAWQQSQPPVRKPTARQVPERTVRTSIAGKIDNTAMPLSRPLAPLYEAIHNALQAIEEAGRKDHSITIDIERLPDMLREGEARPMNFTITDTGIGFDEDNAKSFFTAESRHKAHRGGKGNGRFLWLKAFDSVSVESNFRAENGSMQKRKFVFDRREEQDVPQSAPSTATRTGTTVTLTGFDDRLSRKLSRPLEWFADRSGKASKFEARNGTATLASRPVYLRLPPTCCNARFGRVGDFLPPSNLTIVS